MKHQMPSAMWKKNWGYPEGFAISGALAVTGLLLQACAGPLDWKAMAFPVNGILLVFYGMVLLTLHGLRKKMYIARWMSSYTAAVSALLTVVVWSVIMGLLRQRAGVAANGTGWPGFDRMLSAWPFVLSFLWMTTVLGMALLKRLYPLQWKNLPFLLSHLGLFLAILGAAAGSGDIRKLKMTVTTGKPEWRALNEHQQLEELPLAIELRDFTINEYPPKLLLVSNATGQALPAEHPGQLVLEEGLRKGHIGAWELQIEQQFPEAARVATADTTKYVSFLSRGATYAAYVKAIHPGKGIRREGWVSCGSFLFPYQALSLDEEVSLVMPEREPRRFASDVKVYTRSGHKQTATIEVNRPLSLEGWKIYQLSYDETKGKWSDISIFELVRDPWLPVVYTGIWMLIAGAVCLFITAAQHRKEENV